MKNFIAIFFLFYPLTSCNENCYGPFSPKDLLFVSYSQNQEISLIDTSNVIHTLEQTRYRREFFESCGAFGCSGDHNEVYQIEYRSKIDPDWGFNYSLYSEKCTGGHSWLYVTSDNLETYKEHRWIFEVIPDSVEVKYESINVGGKMFHDVFEFSGFADNTNITMLSNTEFGVIEIRFKEGKSIILLP